MSGAMRELAVQRLARRLGDLTAAGELSLRDAESLGGYLILKAVGDDGCGSRTTRWRRETQARKYGLIDERGELVE
jgi:hypothetical protein